MERVKRQLHEWDENLRDDSLPANPIGETKWESVIVICLIKSSNILCASIPLHFQDTCFSVSIQRVTRPSTSHSLRSVTVVFSLDNHKCINSTKPVLRVCYSVSVLCCLHCRSVRTAILNMVRKLDAKSCNFSNLTINLYIRLDIPFNNGAN